MGNDWCGSIAEVCEHFADGPSDWVAYWGEGVQGVLAFDQVHVHGMASVVPHVAGSERGFVVKALRFQLGYGQVVERQLALSQAIPNVRIVLLHASFDVGVYVVRAASPRLVSEDEDVDSTAEQQSDERPRVDAVDEVGHGLGSRTVGGQYPAQSVNARNVRDSDTVEVIVNFIRHGGYVPAVDRQVRNQPMALDQCGEPYEVGMRQRIASADGEFASGGKLVEQRDVRHDVAVPSLDR